MTEKLITTMSKNTLDAIETNIALPAFLAEKVQRENYSLTDAMHKVLARYPDAEGVLGLSLDNMELFDTHADPKATLMNMPFLALSPTLPDPRDWDTFVNGVLRSRKVEELTDKMPEVDGMTGRDIFHNNSSYVTLLKDVLHMNVLAAPLLGLSLELAHYLKGLPMRRIQSAIGEIKFPLYRWRFDDNMFWTEYRTGWLSNEAVAHYLMRTAQLPPSTLPFKHAWSDLRLDRAQRDVYARALMTQGCRAATATNLFTLNATKARNTYREIHGVSSPCGCNPTSLVWYVEHPTHRLQGTFLAWLYRAALANGGNIPEALIASIDVAEKMFGKELVISPDRAIHLTRAMAIHSRLTMTPCRTCKTEYILSNEQGRIELAKDFFCPGCSYSLKSRSAKKQAKSKTE